MDMVELDIHWRVQVNMSMVATLHSVYFCLTLEQRRQLKSIIDGRTDPRNESTVATLILLGLVKRHGGAYVATESGCYVGRLSDRHSGGKP